jgi:hypothetical protein
LIYLTIQQQAPVLTPSLKNRSGPQIEAVVGKQSNEYPTPATTLLRTPRLYD